MSKSRDVSTDVRRGEDHSLVYLRSSRIHQCGQNPVVESWPKVLASQFELSDQLTVTTNVFVFKVVQQAAPLTDEHQQPTTGVMVVLVDLQVFGEVRDALSDQRDLNLR